MHDEFKTVSFPDNAAGQTRKKRMMAELASQGWQLVSETISKATPDAAQGSSQARTARWCCGPLRGLLPGPLCGLQTSRAKASQGSIQVTWTRSEEARLNAEQVLHEAFIKARDARLRQEEALRRDREDVQMERLLQAYARAHPEAHLSTTIRKAVAHYLQHERRPLGPIPDLAQCHRKQGEVHILDTKGYLLRTYSLDEVKQIVASQP